MKTILNSDAARQDSESIGDIEALAGDLYQKTPRQLSLKHALARTGDRTLILPTHCEIACLAFQLYEERGRRDGNDVEDWLAAEAHVCTDEKHCFQS
jgi:hypothetical protein